jgi:hypothetical protein
MEIEANLSVKLRNTSINVFSVLSNELRMLSRLSNIPPSQKMMNFLTDTIIQSNSTTHFTKSPSAVTVYRSFLFPPSTLTWARPQIHTNQTGTTATKSPTLCGFNCHVSHPKILGHEYHVTWSLSFPPNNRHPYYPLSLPFVPPRSLPFSSPSNVFACELFVWETIEYLWIIEWLRKSAFLREWISNCHFDNR